MTSCFFLTCLFLFGFLLVDLLSFRCICYLNFFEVCKSRQADLEFLFNINLPKKISFLFDLFHRLSNCPCA